MHLVVERLMRMLVIAVIDRAGDLCASILEVLKSMELGAFLFEGIIESLPESVLLRIVGRDIFMLQTVVAE